MIKKFTLSTILLFSFFSVLAQTYITHIAVADLKNQKIRPDQTVVIADGVITHIKKSSKIKIPKQAEVIDGTGKYLFPGLVDAHMHFFQNGGLYTRPDAIDLRAYSSYESEIDLAHQSMETRLRRYLKQGITTVVDVGATPNFLKQRQSFSDKKFAPGIFMTGPLLTTYQPVEFKNLAEDEPFTLTQTVQEGIDAVQAQLKYQPDFIKIWYIAGADGLSLSESARKNLPIIQGIIKEAHNNNLKVAVHATEHITAQLAVESGADFLVHSIEDEVLKEDLVALMLKNKVFLCPTLTVHSGYENTFGQKLDLSPHELRTADPYQLGSLLDLKHIPEPYLVESYKRYANSNRSIQSLKKSDSISLINLKKLADAGIRIVTGTDAGNIGTLHASSYLKELQAMQKSGMNNWELIRASTLNPAFLLDQQEETGTVEVGKKANLIMLDANPIDKLEHLTKINRIINEGKVFTPNELLSDSPQDLVQRQLNAYNLRSVEAFLEPYADDVEVYTFPDKLLYKGKEIMRKNYAALFESTPDLHCKLKNRIVQGNTLIDQELVQMNGEKVNALAIYHIENNRIKKVYFIRD